VKRATLSRRLLAGVAGLAIGLSGALALAAPAQATGGKKTEVDFVDDCTGTTVLLQVGSVWRKYEAVIKAGETTYVDTDQAKGQSYEQFIPSDAGEIRVKVRYKASKHSGWKTLLDKKWTWKNPGWPGENCESPKVEIVEDCDGNVTVTIHAGDTRRTWRVDGDNEKFLDFGEHHTWDAESLDAVVEWWHEGSQEWKAAAEDGEDGYVTRTAAEECPEDEPGEENGGGGELPETGSQLALIAGGSLLLLTLGGGLFLVARRRQISFTA
jgi:LPXTG-motif cell wall-anchored protein